MDIHSETFGGEYPFKPNYVKVKGVRLHYVDEAPPGKPEAEPIVMLHGNPTWSFLYRKFIPPLVHAGYRAIAPDNLGYGRSDTPMDRSLYTLANRIQFFAGLMEILDLRDITLVMQDWGGPIGLGYAVEHPERIKRLVIMSTWAFELPPEFGEQIPALFKQCREPWLGEALLLGYNIFVEGFFPVAIIRKEKLTEELMRAYRAPFPTYNSRIPTMAIQDVPLSKDHPSLPTMKAIEEKLLRLQVPTALIWGASDELLEVSALTQLWKQIYPHSELQLIPRAGHFLQEDAPEEVVAAIQAFLARHP